MSSPSQLKDISLFNDPILSDVKIRQIYKGKTKEYFAHKANLSAHSKWFLKAFTGNFKEATEHSVEVLDDDPRAFEYMLKFMYTNEIVLPPVQCPNHKTKIDRDILTPIRLYILADKYEIAPLLRHTSSQVAAAMNTHSSLLKGEAVPTIVAAYYNCCTCARSVMGDAIASGLIKSPSRWLGHGDKEALGSLVIAHSHFAADLILALRNAGRLR
ncbi:uncharacterized protein ALTATR162_LOCUS6138 [Alternaria atra]|uniref:BTB domain-containing protein n=1 Tax=Alternaria atra TaxID=119953 RepID=A0A8J2I1A8_9PLEO|nr:uncharacterized protein ALTATR162_LOCUS6138 [Alternaria atra]CAG5161995.1 unnamed protein product [Alternaria atra]